MSTPAARWAEQLAAWAIPQHILDQAAVAPWVHDVKTFEVDDTLDRATTSARLAREVLPPQGGTVLDVGCGGGRSALALVPPATELVGVDESAAMLEAFGAAAAAAGVARRTVHGRWPDVAGITPIADVVVCHNVLYNVPDVEPFVLALTDHARLAVVVELPVRHPLSGYDEAWRHFWALERPDGPTDADLVAVLRALGIDPEVVHSPRPTPSRRAGDPDAEVRSAARRLCLGEDRLAELADWLAHHEIRWPDTAATLRWPGSAALDGD